jgi:hypothetical protein
VWTEATEGEEEGGSVISRRGLFRLLGGAAVSPVLKPLAGLIPVSGKIPGERCFLIPQTQTIFWSSRFDPEEFPCGPPEVERVWYDHQGNERRRKIVRCPIGECSHPRCQPSFANPVGICLETT